MTSLSHVHDQIYKFDGYHNHSGRHLSVCVDSHMPTTYNY